MVRHSLLCDGLGGYRKREWGYRKNGVGKRTAGRCVYIHIYVCVCTGVKKSSKVFLQGV